MLSPFPSFPTYPQRLSFIKTSLKEISVMANWQAKFSPAFLEWLKSKIHAVWVSEEEKKDIQKRDKLTKSDAQAVMRMAVVKSHPVLWARQPPCHRSRLEWGWPLGWWWRRWLWQSLGHWTWRLGLDSLPWGRRWWCGKWWRWTQQRTSLQTTGRKGTSGQDMKYGQVRKAKPSLMKKKSASLHL